MRASFLAAAILAFVCGLAAPARAQSDTEPTGASIIIYGNYCGPGQNGINPKPIDALDTACMHHDACTPDHGLPSCSCHARLRAEAHQVAITPRVSDYTRNMALFIQEFTDLMACQD